MGNNYVLNDRKQIFFYNRFCLAMDNIEAIKKSNVEKLVLGFGEMNNFIEKVKERVNYNKNFAWKKKVSFN